MRVPEMVASMLTLALMIPGELWHVGCRGAGEHEGGCRNLGTRPLCRMITS
jgi:hypothetical protein